MLNLLAGFDPYTRVVSILGVNIRARTCYKKVVLTLSDLCVQEVTEIANFVSGKSRFRFGCKICHDVTNACHAVIYSPKKNLGPNF